ncbi:tRNA-uridine aminocarboxypropyltransferase [Clostridium sp. C2-6-12]|uniref:tRNA-uridine aminocarboxypropyltransferase n=1 Tax=Clostridium sp. C2-6-12 TaxID=2698832 RepID=UPI001368BE23|nr:tRNA-uridine aminocarboxypropyltransferase [Clostridium sp. C2-6-12]
MDLKYKVKQITKLYESCSECGLPTINCICNSVVKIKTNAKIWILSTEREFSRPSNTARLIKLINPDSTELILWERTKAPEKLIEYINSEEYEIYILFPTEDSELLKRKVQNENSGKITAFIILDGTWKEASKILRKSEYLKNLPKISLDPIHKSEYTLRRGASEGELCTMEAAIEVLKLNCETEKAQVAKNTFDLFLKSFKAGISGLPLK